MDDCKRLFLNAGNIAADIAQFTSGNFRRMNRVTMLIQQGDFLTVALVEYSLHIIRRSLRHASIVKLAFSGFLIENLTLAIEPLSAGLSYCSCSLHWSTGMIEHRHRLN